MIGDSRKECLNEVLENPDLRWTPRLKDKLMLEGMTQFQIPFLYPYNMYNLGTFVTLYTSFCYSCVKKGIQEHQKNHILYFDQVTVEALVYFLSGSTF